MFTLAMGAMLAIAPTGRSYSFYASPVKPSRIDAKHGNS